MVKYIINLNKLRENYTMFSKFGLVFFPVKTNHNSIILKELKRLGCGFEVDSISHLKKVYSKKIANKILFSNVAKSYKDILWAIKHKISYYTVDDEASLKQIIHLAIKYKMAKLKLNIRLNVYECFKKEFDNKNTLDSRLGAYIVNAKHLFNIINAENKIEIEKGISFYIQAEIHNEENCLEKMLEYISKSFEKDIQIDFIDIGGGANKQRLNFSRHVLKQTLEHFGAKYIVLEPGRYLVGDVEDVYIPCVRVVNNLEYSEEIVASLELGIYNGLNDIKLHNRLFDFYIYNDGTPMKLERAKKDKPRLVLRGPTADSLDLLGFYTIPDCKIDNHSVFVIKNVGAYVEVFDSSFSGKVKTCFVTM